MDSLFYYVDPDTLSLYIKKTCIHKIAMYICVMYSKELLKGTLQPVILNLLKGNKRMYGYEITQTVKKLTQGKIEITEGALYPTLHKLASEGILRVEEVYIGKRIRKYYMLTETGTLEGQQKVQEVNDFFAVISLLLKPSY